ncbi:MAG TPA: 50S ribosomal protein L13 [Candidatus Babeliales bacterium]|nr:50S ribosomal protein L13 [Candidatus Babeliales bacterium]
MDMNKAFYLRKEDQKPKWHVIDARGKIVGRLATKVADILHGKHVPIYTPHSDAGDYVVIINAKDVVFTGKKWQQKTHYTYSGWMGGQKSATMEELGAVKVLELAIERMLPKSKLGRSVIKKLRIYEGAEHPHIAQMEKAR